MRPLHQHDLSDWLHLRPLTQGYKTAAYRLSDALFSRRGRDRAAAFAERFSALEGRPIAIVIAFEKPELTAWQLRFAARNLTDMSLVVADNSRRQERAVEIAAVCREAGAPYVRLPPNPSRQAMRSHGLALNWAVRNLAARLAPPVLAVIDHDLVPVVPTAIPHALDRQPFYGLLRDRPFYGQRDDRTRGWYLWPGFAFYDAGRVDLASLDFLPDWFVGLDTGGMNYWRLHRRFDKAAFDYARSEMIDAGRGERVELIDGAWLHLGNASRYDLNLPDRVPLFVDLLGRVWDADPRSREALEALIAAPLPALPTG